MSNITTAVRDTNTNARIKRTLIKFLEYRSRVLPEIPLYSNAYMDFHISALRNYYPGAYSSWSEAIQKAYMSDFVEEEDDWTDDGWTDEEDGEVFD